MAEYLPIVSKALDLRSREKGPGEFGVVWEKRDWCLLERLLLPGGPHLPHIRAPPRRLQWLKMAVGGKSLSKLIAGAPRSL